MDTKQLEVFKSSLENKKTELMNRVQALNDDKTRQRGALTANLEEQAQDIENDEVVDGLEELERTQLAQINAAIDRIENGSYGQCLSCGNEIAQTRLEAVPFSTNCIKCAN